MKKKPLLAIALVVTLAFAALLAWSSIERNRSSAEQFDGNTQISSSEDSKGAQISTGIEPTPIKSTSKTDALGPESVEEPLYQLAQIQNSFDPVADAKRLENAPFRIQGRGSKAKIVTAEGKTLIEADDKVGIYGCSVSPDGKRLTVYYGDAKYDVITPSTGETIRLPQHPPGENMIGFGSWDWIDTDTLVGVSGTVIPFREDEVGPAREEPNISQSLLYVYKLSERKLMEVELPPELQNKTFSVSVVDSSGNVQLGSDDHDSSSDANLGWFDVRAMK